MAHTAFSTRGTELPRSVKAPTLRLQELEDTPIHKVLEIQQRSQSVPELLIYRIQALMRDHLLLPEIRRLFTPSSRYCTHKMRSAYDRPSHALTYLELSHIKHMVEAMVTARFKGWESHPVLPPREAMTKEQLLELLSQPGAPGIGFVLEALMDLDTFPEIRIDSLAKALFHAIKSGETESVMLFLNSPRSKELSSEEFKRCLTVAIRHNRINIIHSLNSTRLFLFVVVECLGRVLKKPIKKKLITIEQIFESFYLPALSFEEFATTFKSSLENDSSIHISVTISMCPICSSIIYDHLGRGLLTAVERNQQGNVKALLEPSDFHLGIVPYFERALQHAVTIGNVELAGILILNPLFPRITQDAFLRIELLAQAFQRLDILTRLKRNEERIAWV